jgi:hypothetical protein
VLGGARASERLLIFSARLPGQVLPLHGAIMLVPEAVQNTWNVLTLGTTG